MAMEEDIDFIMRQTNYTREISYQKLIEHDHNKILVIKEFMGIPFSHKEVPKKSIQQEIYSQIRKKIDITEFYKKQNEKLEKEIQENNHILYNENQKEVSK
jgi:hypothetical protein